MLFIITYFFFFLAKVVGNKNGQHQLGTQRRGEGRGKKRVSKGNLNFISKNSHQKFFGSPNLAHRGEEATREKK